MGCCVSRCSRRRDAESSPNIDEETEVPADVAQNLKDVPEADTYLTSSDEDQLVVPQDRRPRLSLIPVITDLKNDATRISSKTASADVLTSTDVLDAHMGVQRADSIPTYRRRRSQWEAVALTIAAKRRSRDVTNAPENINRVSWSSTAGSPSRKRRTIEEPKEASPRRHKCPPSIGTCQAAADEE